MRSRGRQRGTVGQPEPRRFVWPPELAALLGKLPDLELARRAGVATATVAAARRRRGIAALPAPPAAAPPRARWAWDPEEVAMLGTASDAAVARTLGRSLLTVRRKRCRLRIRPAPRGAPQRPLPRPPAPIAVRRQAKTEPFVWARHQVALLGKMSDARLARLAGIGEEAVARARARRGIAPWQRRSGFVWQAHAVALLGTASDGDVAAALAIPRWQVKNKRHQLGIPPFVPPPHAAVNRRKWTPAAAALLGTMPDGQLARRLGLSVSTVATERRRRGVAPFTPRHPGYEWTPEIVACLGQLPDPEIARRFEIPLPAVKAARRRRGIPGPVNYGVVVPTAELRALLARPTAEVRRRSGLAPSTIRRLRRQLGVMAQRLNRPCQPAEEALIGAAPDAEVAKALGRSVEAIRARRWPSRQQPAGRTGVRRA